ncbi:MAG: hypothetical protein ACRCX2_28900 [Paraclostridium sp.]
MRIEDIISKRLVAKLKECGMLKADIFTPEKMDSANRLYLDISTNGQAISYITKERIERFQTPDGGLDVWNEDLRKKFAIQTRPGRVIQTIYGTELPYSEQRKLRFMLFDGTDYEVQVVSGTDIAKYYNVDYYEERRGDLGGSCMSRVPSNFFEIYRREARMAVVMKKSTQKICARALIFDNCKSGTGMEDRPLMCRIYSNDDIFYDMIKNWAIDNNIWIFDGGYAARKFITGHDQYFNIDEYKPYFLVNYWVMDDIPFTPYMDNFEYCVKARVEGELKYAFSPYYVYPFGGSCINYYNTHDTQGGDTYCGEGQDYCYNCEFPCSECHKNEHGGWDRDNYDDDDYDYDEDDSDW